VDLPPEVTGDPPGSFAWTVLHERHPALVRQVRDAHPYPPGILASLDRLAASLPDRSWDAVPFLEAEGRFYGELLDAVGWSSPGPWAGLDPFTFLKRAELVAPRLVDDLAALDEVVGLPPRERTAALLQAALWANRADLGFAIGLEAAGSAELPSAALVADDSAAAVSSVHEGLDSVVVLADNAGRELLADLMLIDHLVAAGLAREVVLHLKPRPWFVSDATVADLVACLDRLRAAGGSAGAAAGRLHAAIGDGRVAVRANWFSAQPFELRLMPPDLADDLAAASLVLVKGDLNYRRLVGDRRWDPATPLAAVTGYLPAPVLALRTLKSDVVVGLDPATASSLEESGGSWRTDGTHALVQLRPWISA
jgi:Damage-control phosphatase ARMT1-like domain